MTFPPCVQWFKRLVLVASSLSIVLFAGVIQSHQQKESYTNVLFNPRTNNLEVSHRFYIHDAEHALSELFRAKADIISDKETQKRFADYIQTQFQLRIDNDKQLHLSLVGYHVEGKFFYIYQETSIPKVKSIKVKYSALQDIWPKQVNQVNFEKDHKVRSVRLDQQSHWEEVTIQVDME